MRLILAAGPAPQGLAPAIAPPTFRPAVQMCDLMGCQDDTPLLDALVKAAGSVRAPFFFPGDLRLPRDQILAERHTTFARARRS